MHSEVFCSDFQCSYVHGQLVRNAGAASASSSQRITEDAHLLVHHQDHFCIQMLYSMSEVAGSVARGTTAVHVKHSFARHVTYTFYAIKFLM